MYHGTLNVMHKERLDYYAILKMHLCSSFPFAAIVGNKCRKRRWRWRFLLRFWSCSKNHFQWIFSDNLCWCSSLFTQLTHSIPQHLCKCKHFRALFFGDALSIYSNFFMVSSWILNILNRDISTCFIFILKQIDSYRFQFVFLINCFHHLSFSYCFFHFLPIFSVHILPTDNILFAFRQRVPFEFFHWNVLLSVVNKTSHFPFYWIYLYLVWHLVASRNSTNRLVEYFFALTYFWIWFVCCSLL